MNEFFTFVFVAVHLHNSSWDFSNSCSFFIRSCVHEYVIQSAFCYIEWNFFCFSESGCDFDIERRNKMFEKVGAVLLVSAMVVIPILIILMAAGVIK
jgi:hypothetical protein